MQLSEHFSLAELTVTLTGLTNLPSAKEYENLVYTVQRMEVVRAICGNHPISVSSGYRCPAVNTAAGGAPTSAHLTGFAVDFIVPGFDNDVICRKLWYAGMEFDQLISEVKGQDRWIHISFAPENRREWLKSIDGKYEVQHG